MNKIIENINIKLFSKFSGSAVISALVDFGAFYIFCLIYKPFFGMLYITAATVTARVISSVLNYFLNRRIFKSTKKISTSGALYAFLVIINVILSAACVSGLVFVFKIDHEIIAKIIVDGALFVMNYFIERKYIY